MIADAFACSDLGSSAAARLPGDLVDERPRRGELDGARGERERDALEVDDALAELLALAGVLERDLERALGAAEAARRDHQALLDEPLARQLVALAETAEHLRVRHLAALEHVLGVLVHERVHVAGAPRLAQARGALVDQERRRAVALGVGDDDQVVGDVRGRHEPLLAIDAPAARRARARASASLLASDPAPGSVTA